MTQYDRITSETPAALLRLCPAHQQTPFFSLPSLAERLGVQSVWVKHEGRRPLGSFKALGGVYAGLRALARSSGMSVADLLDPRLSHLQLPALICASDGNHGLAIAAAARLAGAPARVFLPTIVPDDRVARIVAKGADVVRVPGTYEDAVGMAAEAARRGDGLLVADTGDDPGDPIVADVMSGYSVIGEEICSQLAEGHHPMPTHLFVQAGVGGLAAAMADGLLAVLATPARIVVVEPASAACVGAGLIEQRQVVVSGSLNTSAEMLSCGQASAPALAILLRSQATAVAVPEAAFLEAVEFLSACGGPATTASGAAGLAGLRHALADPVLTATHELGPDSRVLLIVTEGRYDGVGERG